MMIRGMIEHYIQDNSDSPIVSFLYQPAEILKAAEERVDPSVIADVVPEIFQG